jgi:SAM-dependent methyltransferase
MLQNMGFLKQAYVSILPERLRWRLMLEYRKREFFNYAKARFGSRFKALSAGPLPPPELITTEALMHEHDLQMRSTRELYFGTGYREARAVLSTVEDAGLDLGKLQSVLEFGCGSSRVLRHLRVVDDLVLTGADANPKPLEWDRRNITGITYQQNGLEPPLSFPDASFDLIYALSVFTHIPIEWQKSWLVELRRVLRPGGILMCTVHGKAYDDQLSADDHARLSRDGAVTLDADNPRASYSSQVLRSWDVFQTREEVRASFGSVFEILSYPDQPWANAQDVLVLRKSAGFFNLK